MIRIENRIKGLQIKRKDSSIEALANHVRVYQIPLSSRKSRIMARYLKSVREAKNQGVLDESQALNLIEMSVKAYAARNISESIRRSFKNAKIS